MATKWVKVERGIRYREHGTRKNGVRLDRYYVVRYTVDGEKRQEALGWESEGWPLDKVRVVLSKLREAKRTGEGERTLAEKRAKAEAKRKAEKEVGARAALEAITFGDVFTGSYFPAQFGNKAKSTCQQEDGFFRNWIAPVIGDKPMKDVSPFDLERIKRNMAEAGRASKSIHHVLATIRQVFNFAQRTGLHAGDNPVSLVKKPVADNRRIRFLTVEEAEALLRALRERVPNVADMALLSLHCGLRAGEVFNLTWNDVDFERYMLTLRDTKSGRTRHVPMTKRVRSMLQEREKSDPAGLVFPAVGGGKAKAVSNSFDRAVQAVGLNDGIEDRRQKVVYHSLRHTYASWLVERGVDIYTVKELLGHTTLAMTTRYSHLAPDTLRRAVKTLDKIKPGRLTSISRRGGSKEDD